MATQITVGKKTTSLPGIYSTVRSGITNPPSAVDYGNVVIIDDGSLGANSFIAINGVLGTNKQGADAAMVIDSNVSITSRVWDSPLVPIINGLYKPSNKAGVAGINKLVILQAAATTPGTATITFANGSITLKTVFEGTSMNGTINTVEKSLASGFGIRVEAGRSFGYSVVFYKGQHNRMEDPKNPGFGFNGYSLPTSFTAPKILFRSPDVRTLPELIRWMQKSTDFKTWFTLTGSTIPVPATNLITNADLTETLLPSARYIVFTGGTAVYSPEALSEAIEVAKEIDNTFFFALAPKETATTNTCVLALKELVTSGTLPWEKYLIVGGYETKANFTESKVLAQTFNSSKVIVVHGAAREENLRYPDGLREISVLEKAAKVIGRIAGLTPQTPVTWKDIALKGEIHRLRENEKEDAVKAGLLCTVWDAQLENFIILAGVNSLQDNENFVNEDGQSHNVALERVKSQINKELIFEGKKYFFGQEQGPNRSTMSPVEVVEWTKTFLNKRVATPQKDNLLLRVDEVIAFIQNDNIFIDYKIVANTEISKAIFGGVLIAN